MAKNLATSDRWYLVVFFNAFTEVAHSGVSENQSSLEY